MLAAQLKRVSPCDLVEPLKEYIVKEYPELSPFPYDEALEKLNQLRVDVTTVLSPSTISRHVLLSYFSQLQLMEGRFPVSESNLKLPFTWCDSFSPRQSMTQSTLKYEKACVLFQLGALESQAGVQEDRSSVDGLKSACKSFMQSAGAFESALVQSQEFLGPRYVHPYIPVPTTLLAFNF